jgi:hypothetical protein
MPAPVHRRALSRATRRNTIPAFIALVAPPRARARPDARAIVPTNPKAAQRASHRVVSHRTCATVSSNGVNAAPFALTIYSFVIVSPSVAVRGASRRARRGVVATSRSSKAPARAPLSARARTRGARDGAR